MRLQKQRRHHQQATYTRACCKHRTSVHVVTALDVLHTMVVRVTIVGLNPLREPSMRCKVHALKTNMFRKLTNCSSKGRGGKGKGGGGGQL